MSDSELLKYLDLQLKKKNSLENLARTIVATLKVNFDKGYLFCKDANGNDTLKDLINKWQERIEENK